MRNVDIEGVPAGPDALRPSADHAIVTSDFFATLGIPFVEGGTFPPEFRADGRDVVIINESMARRFWPGQSAIGRRISGGTDASHPVWREVIGVVRDVDFPANNVRASTPFHVYRPLALEPWGYASLAVRGASRPTLVAALQTAVREVDPNIPVTQISTASEFVSGSQRSVQLVSQFLAAFAVLGLTLAAVGLYGVIAHVVAQRTAEFGIRLALGAGPANIFRLVLGNGVRLAAVGIGIGLLGAYGLAQALSAAMPRVASIDAVALGAVTILLFGVALLACWLPARRATKVDPLVALRAD
jgi:ABC-type antimicrobial peptide transport system permease subunit